MRTSAGGGFGLKRANQVSKGGWVLPSAKYQVEGAGLAAVGTPVSAALAVGVVGAASRAGNVGRAGSPGAAVCSAPGVEPALGGSVSPMTLLRAPAASRRPNPLPPSRPAGQTSAALVSSACRNWSLVRSGRTLSSSAATPETCGAAADVPVVR